MDKLALNVFVFAVLTSAWYWLGIVRIDWPSYLLGAALGFAFVMAVKLVYGRFAGE